MRRVLPAVCVAAFVSLCAARGSETHALFLNAIELSDKAAEEAVQEQIARFQQALAETGRLPLSQQTAPDDAPLTKERIQQELQKLSRRTPKGGRAVVYLRAYAAKKGGGNLRIYPASADPAVPVDEQPGVLLDTELDAWLTDLFEGSETLLFLDLIAQQPSIAVFYTNRIQIGTNSVHMIVGRPVSASLAGVAAEVLKRLEDALDSNDDRVIDMGEIANAVQNEASRYEWAKDSAFSGTGDGAAALLELLSAVVITAAPGASALINGKEVGPVTARLEAEPGRTYMVSAAKEGYRAVEPKAVSVSRPYGEAASARFFLEPIRIRASIRLPAGEPPPAVLTARFRPGAGLLRELEEKERAELDLNSADYSLEAGTEYHLLIGTPDNTLFGAAAFTFGGGQDIQLEIPLEKRTEWQVAQIYFEEGFQDHALKTAEKARNAAYDIPQMSVEFMTFLFSAWSKEEQNPRAMIGSALLAAHLADFDTSRDYWKQAKETARDGSADRDYASRGLRSVGGGWATYAVILGFLALVVSSTVLLVLRHRRLLQASDSPE